MESDIYEAVVNNDDSAEDLLQFAKGKLLDGGTLEVNDPEFYLEQTSLLTITDDL